ncbi:Polyketide synthase [Madurella fahalii]|uniref:Polyketide synthase n=1 Tax=Madurella fahalii TaxID=1157608 RepID=A0ABQ0G3K1_9PEZI
MGIPEFISPPAKSVDIAVVGLACRFPGGSSEKKLWELLSNKRSAFTKAPESRYNADAFHHAAGEKLNTLSALGGHFLEEDVAAFDAPFFSITAQEATAMDPTARMLLEVTYEALENAGLPIENIAGSDTSCYVGCFTRDYHEMLMRDAETAPMYAGTGTGFSLLSNRVSWFYDLRGPSMTLDTACSSSLVGLHLACQGLRNGESKVALVSGANLILSPDLGMWLSNLRMTSTDGLSRSFADAVTGYGRGEGIATLVLKPMHDALRDGDPIRAVIRGTGVNQDGHTTGITVPNRDAQGDLIRSTYRSAGLDVSQTPYFEAHGTGTAVGDPLELGAVYQTMSAVRAPGDPLYVGSVKSNIGHLEGAAGLAGVIKCILMLEQGVILPNIHFDQPSKRIPFDKWNIKVPTEVISWPKRCLRRASVNSFGYGGTNAHAIIDNADDFLATDRGALSLSLSLSQQQKLEGVNLTNGAHTHPRLFIFNAASESALLHTMKRTANYLIEKREREQDDSVYLDRLAFTLSDRRSQFPWRAVTMAKTLAELSSNLLSSSSPSFSSTDDSPSSSSKPHTLLAHAAKKQLRVAFIFTGQGAQWARMGAELFQAYPVFRKSVQDADTHLRVWLGSEWSVMAEMEKDATESRINLAQYSQPLCTVLQVALVELLRSWNIEPAGVVGHSSGEIAAAYCCGALTREDAWTVAYYRGKICSELSRDDDAGRAKGAMMAVGLSAEAAGELVREVKAGTVVVACVNSPSSVTISGDATGIDELHQTLTARGIFYRKLQVEHAYHSHHMRPIADAYLGHIASITTAKETFRIPMASSVTGQLVSTPEQLGPAYWAQNLVSPVLFTDALATLLNHDPSRRRRRARPGESAFDLLLEVGPHSTLKGPLRQILRQQNISTVTYVSLLHRGENAAESAVRAASQLYIHGVPVRVRAVNRSLDTTSPPIKPLVDLPSYPWDHFHRYWAESRLSRNYRLRRFGRHDLLGAPAADASAKQPRWRNILRVQDQPWLRHHVVQSSILFPAAGSLAMVLEAVQQLASNGKRLIESIKLQDVRITKAIVIPDDQAGIEAVLQLHYHDDSSDDREDSWDFSLQSCSDIRSLDPTSSGRVTVRYAPTEKLQEEAWTTGKKLLWQTAKAEYATALENCVQTIDPGAFYKAIHDAGLQYGLLFQGLAEIATGSGRCTTTVKITDTKASMPAGAQSAHLIHPTTLDVIFHSMFTAMTDRGESKLGFKRAAVPISFDSLIFYTGIPSMAGDQLRSCCRIQRDGLHDLVADIYVSSDMAFDTPKIIVKGIRCRELPPSATAGTGSNSTSNGPTTNVKAPVGTLVWKPDLPLLDEAKLRDYLERDCGNWPEFVSIVDLAAHKNPDLAILEIGPSGVVIDSLLPILRASQDKRDKNMRCSRYTVLVPETEAVPSLREKFSLLSGVLSSDALKPDAWIKAESLYDMVVVHGGVLADEQIQQLKKCVRVGGNLLVRGRLEDDSESSWAIIYQSPTSGWCLARNKIEMVPSAIIQPVVLIEPAEPSSEVLEISHQLSSQLASLKIATETIQWSGELELERVQGKTLVSLLEIQSAFLQDISAQDFAALKTLLLNSARVLWVAKGEDPAMQAAMGYLRVLKNENINLDLRYLLFEDHAGRSPTDVVQMLVPVVVSPTTDREYVERNRCLCINRWVDDDHLSRIMTAGNEDAEQKHVESERLRLGDVKTPLRLLWSSVFHTADDASSSPLNAEEVEVQLKAITVNSPTQSMIQFAGLITKTGSSCNRLRPGDAVWGCVAANAPRTVFRVKQFLCQLLPPGGKFEEAASWAHSLGTAYGALMDTARLQEGQTVLIQAAASVVGQFAVQLAQQLKSVVLVMVSNGEQRQTVLDLGVASEYVLEEGDPDLEAAVDGLTHGKGVDVILHQSSTRKLLQRLGSCVTATGVLVDVDPLNHDDAALSARLRRDARYSLFDFSKIMRDDPSKLGGILQSVAVLLSQNSFQQPVPQTTWRASQMEEALDWARSHPQDTAILCFDADDMVPVTADFANPLALDAEATYLLVGGTGGLGASLATFLARNGARHLAVVSRSGPSSRNASSFTQDLASMGVQATLYAADASDETAMRRVLERCAAKMPPIRGVVQCAAVLDDSVYHNMTHEQWRNATRPKMHGSWLLHRLLPRDLHFFVMLSSIAGVVGNRGQANYAAGNTYQDALAHYRRARGLPAVAVDLGLMLGIGLIAERGGATNLKKWEAVGVREHEFHRLMTAAIAGCWSKQALPAQIICGLPTGGVLQSERLERPFYFDDPRFAYLRKKDVVAAAAGGTGRNGDGDDGEESLAEQLGRVQSLCEATDIVSSALRHRLSRELQTDIKNIDAGRPLHGYGIDSLIAVEIRNWIVAHLQAETSLFDVLGAGSIQALAARIAAISKAVPSTVQE